MPFGTFRRELFEKIGYFDERLARNQDSEFNDRIIRNGGKIYLFNDIKITYYPRDTICKLIKMAVLNGKWNLYTNYLVPGSMRIRHFVPFVFLMTIILGMIGIFMDINIVKKVFFIEIITYILLDLIFSFKNIKENNFKESFICTYIYIIFHIAYGYGTLLGIFLILKNNKMKEGSKIED